MKKLVLFLAILFCFLVSACQIQTATPDQLSAEQINEFRKEYPLWDAPVSMEPINNVEDLIKLSDFSSLVVISTNGALHTVDFEISPFGISVESFEDSMTAAYLPVLIDQVLYTCDQVTVGDTLEIYIPPAFSDIVSNLSSYNGTYVCVLRELNETARDYSASEGISCKYYCTPYYMAYLTEDSYLVSMTDMMLFETYTGKRLDDLIQDVDVKLTALGR